MAIFYFKIIVLIIEIFLFEFFQCACANNTSENEFLHAEIFSQNQSLTSPPPSVATTTMNKVFQQFFKSYAAKRRAHLAKMYPARSKCNF